MSFQNIQGIRIKNMNQELIDHFNNIRLLIAIDHSRAGNNFFKRIFDQHEQVLSITAIDYLYGSILRFLGSRKKISGIEAYEWAIGADSPIQFLTQPSTARHSSVERSVI